MFSSDLSGFSHAVAELYAAVHTPARLLPALQQLEKLLDVDMIHLLLNTTDEQQAPLQIVTNNSFHAAAASYNAHYSAIDPRKDVLKRFPVGQFKLCESMFSAREVARNPFYQEWLIPNGGRYTAGGCVYRDARQHAHLSIHHFNGRKPFDSQKTQLLSMLMPHCVQAMQLWMQAQGLRQASQLSQWALDRLQYGLLAVDTAGRTCYINPYAENLLGRLPGESQYGALAAQGVLRGLMVRCQIQNACCSALLPTAQGAVCCLAMPAGQARQGMALPAWHLGEVSCLLVLSAERQRLVAPAGQLAEMFGLTAAESRLAHSLAAGGSLESHAENFCISINTVRTQLRHLLEKTGEARQQDLVRKLVLIPAL